MTDARHRPLSADVADTAQKRLEAPASPEPASGKEILHDYILGGLRSLGNTPDTVARTLYDLGIRMPANRVVSRSRCCPISQYVASHVPKGCVVVTVAGAAYIHAPGVFVDGNVSVRNPEPVVDFIIDFDNGKYPELVEEN